MNAVAEPYRLPDDRLRQLRKAKLLVWISIGFMLSIIVLIAIVMGASQTLKAMWVEDLLSLVPLISFLVGVRFRAKDPDESFPYGYRRAVLMGYLTGAVALFGFGVYIFGDSVFKLIKAEHPTITSVELFGHRIWLGWIMFAALIYSVIPPMILGHLKLPLASDIHDKSLYISATLDKGDWLSGLAGAAGILGIAWGFWWADGLAAAVISIEIVKDGYEELRDSAAQLMNQRPIKFTDKKPDEAIDKVQQALESLPWIAKARVRLREDGDVLTGEAFVQPKDTADVFPRLDEARKVVYDTDWRLHDVSIVLVKSADN